MDPLSIAAAIVALYQATRSAYKLARSLRRSSQRVKGARDEIWNFAKDVELYGCLIGAAQVALEPYSNADHPHSDVISYLSANQVLERLIEEFERLTEHISKYVPNIRALRGSSEFWARFKWGLQKRDIEALGPKMESVKCSLQIVMLSLLLEKHRQQPRTRATNREIKRLNRQIKIHIGTIEILQEQLETRSAHALRETDRSFVSFSLGLQDALVDLGTNMASVGRVPGFPPSPVSSRSSRSSTVFQEAHVGTGNQHPPPRSRHHSTTSMSIVAVDPPGPQHQSTRSIPTLFEDRSNTSQSRYHSNLSVSIPPIRNLQPQRQSLQFGDIIQVPQPPDPIPEDSTSATSDEGGPSNSPLPVQLEGDFAAVYENNYLLHLNPSHIFRSTSGYIGTTPGQLISATALVDSNFGTNLISQAYAARLGLEIDFFDDEKENENQERTIIDFGDGMREKCVGEVRLIWGKGLESRRKSFTVHCKVCVHDVRPLVFGRPFIEKREHYWYRDRNRVGGRDSLSSLD